MLRLRKHPAHGGVGVAKVGHSAGADHLRRGRVRWRRCRRPRRHDLDGCTGRMGAHGDAHRGAHGGAHGGLHGRVLPARWRRTKSNVAWEWKTTAPPSVVTSLVTSLVPFLVVPSVVPFLVAAFVAAFVAAGCLGPSSNLSCRIHKCGLPCRLGWRVVLQLQAVGHGGQRPAHGAVGRGMAEPDASMRAPSARQRRLGRVCGPAALPALCALRKPPRPRLPGRKRGRQEESDATEGQRASQRPQCAVGLEQVRAGGNPGRAAGGGPQAAGGGGGEVTRWLKPHVVEGARRGAR